MAALVEDVPSLNILLSLRVEVGDVERHSNYDVWHDVDSSLNAVSTLLLIL